MKSDKKDFYIEGMTCVNCEHRIKEKLQRTGGIKEISINDKKRAEVIYDPDNISFEEITDIIEDLGYEVIEGEEEETSDISRVVSLLVIIIALYILLRQTGVLNLLVPGSLADSKMSYGILFVTGLLTSVHCIAMCGGVQLTQCIGTVESTDTDKSYRHFLPSLFYNLGRLISYTAIGFILGLIGRIIGGGSDVGIPLLLQGILKMAAGCFMVLVGLNMLNIFPWIRKIYIKICERIKIERKGAATGRPLFIGLLNGLMPCGPLQSMQIVALACANPFTGAISMFFFCLGTIPLMLGLGSLVSALGRRFTSKVMQIGAVLITVLGLAMFSQGSSLSGLFLPEKISDTESGESPAEIVEGTQTVRSTLYPGQYPDITVQAGIPVKWYIDAPAGSINGCNYKIIINELGIEYSFTEGENIIEFTPTEAGTIPYTCWMGMIHGNIFVTE